MKYFQNKVAESSFTLPVVLALYLLASVAVMILNHGDWVSLPLVAMSTFLMMELNNHCLLLRVRSRMVSVTFIVLTMMCGWVNLDWHVGAIQLGFVGFVYLASLTCQDRNSAGRIFYAFLMIALVSLIWVYALWMVPLLLFFLVVPLYSLSFRGLNACVMALLLPYFVGSLYLIYNNDIEILIDHLMPLISLDVLLDYSCVTIGMIVNYVALFVLTITGTIHFVRKSYLDKIKTRIFYHFFISLALILLVVIPIVPLFAQYLISILCIPVAPLVAHYITLTSTKITNVSFYVILVIVILITIFNQCLTSLSNMVLSV